MKRSLLTYAFLAMVVVALLSVGVAGLITRSEATAAFGDYLQTLPASMGRGMMGAGGMMGAPEQTFLAAVDKGIPSGLFWRSDWPLRSPESARTTSPVR